MKELEPLFASRRAFLSKVEGSRLRGSSSEALRPSLEAIIKENKSKLEALREIEPPYPKVTEAFDRALEKSFGFIPSYISSFSHTSLTFNSDKVFSLMLAESLLDLSWRGLHISYDMALPRADASHVLVLGSNIKSPKVFSKNPERVPYFFQEFSEEFLKSFASEELFLKYYLNRIKGQSFFSEFSKSKRKAFLKQYSERLLEMRKAFLDSLDLGGGPSSIITRANNTILGLCSVKEGFTTYSKLRDILLLSLRVLYEDYAINFLEVLGTTKQGPLRKVVKAENGKTLKNICRDIEVNGKQVKLDGAVFFMEEVFEMLELGGFELTVPSIVLASSIAPFKPHMGGKDWFFYAPKLYEKIAETLGLHELSNLILNSYAPIPYEAYILNGTSKLWNSSLWHGYPFIGGQFRKLYEQDLSLKLYLTGSIKN